MPAPLAHVEIPVADLERAMGFYAALFGIAFAAPRALHGGRIAEFPFAEEAGGASAALAEGEVYRPGLHGAILYFTVSDLAATLRRAEDLGSRLLFPITEAGDGLWVAEIEDSEGNRLGLQQL